MFRNLRLVYITTKNREEALSIGKALVEKKIVACVNIFDKMESLYWWKGEIETDTECILIAKTTYSNVNRLTKIVKQMHSYDVPCIISFNIAEQEGNEEYLDWIRQSVLPPIVGSEKKKNSE